MKYSLVNLKPGNIERFLLLSIIFLQFPFHSRYGDDWPNSQLTKYMQWRYGELTPEMFLTMVWKATEDWMNGQGRFFPVAGLQGQLTLFFLKSDLALAIFYGIFICICIFCWVKILDNLFSNKIIGTFFLLASIFIIRFRGNFDPHIGFAQLVIWSFFWVCISILCCFKALSDKKRILFSVLGGLFYFTALCQYELSLVTYPVIIFLTFSYYKYRCKIRFTKYLKILLPVNILTILYLLFVFAYLRPRANPTGNYISGFDLVESSKIFVQTVFAVVPQFGMGINDIFLLPKMSMSILLASILIFTYILIIMNFFTSSLARNSTKKRLSKGEESQEMYSLHRKEFKIFFIGSMLILISGPSFILSIQPNWWGYFKFGQTYLGIFYSEVGLSSLIAYVLWKMHINYKGN